MLAYAALHLAGYARPTLDDIRNFRQLHSPCAGHPENFELAGVETTTGPLGQGLATSVGMAIAERHLNALYGDDLVDHRTWVIAGDGCLMEGINHEAIGLAGHLGLGRLTVLWDDNKITIDGVDRSVDQRRHPRALCGDRLARRKLRRARSRRHPPRDRRRARRSASVADRVPHDHRLRCPEQAGHVGDARCSARRRRDRRGAQGTGLDRRAFRHSRRYRIGVGGVWREGQEASFRME